MAETISDKLSILLHCMMTLPKPVLFEQLVNGNEATPTLQYMVIECCAIIAHACANAFESAAKNYGKYQPLSVIDGVWVSQAVCHASKSG